jgi:hypothetical protein
MLNSALVVKAGLVAIGLVMGTLGTGVGAWLTLGREVVTRTELHTEVQETIQGELSALVTRVEKIDDIHETVGLMGNDVAVLKAILDRLEPQISRLEQKIDRHMELNGDNGS